MFYYSLMLFVEKKCRNLKKKHIAALNFIHINFCDDMITNSYCCLFPLSTDNISAKHDGSVSQLNFNMANMDWFSCCETSLDVIKWLTHLEVVDGVGRGKPGGARVLLGTEGPIEGLGDSAQVEGTHRRCRNTIAL